MYFNREAPIRGHLRNVYACIASASLVAAVGAYVHCSGKTSSHNVSEDVKMNYKLKSMFGNFQEFGKEEFSVDSVRLFSLPCSLSPEIQKARQMQHDSCT
jgi:hypothetical protein